MFSSKLKRHFKIIVQEFCSQHILNLFIYPSSHDPGARMTNYQVYTKIGKYTMSIIFLIDIRYSRTNNWINNSGINIIRHHFITHQHSSNIYDSEQSKFHLPNSSTSCQLTYKRPVWGRVYNLSIIIQVRLITFRIPTVPLHTDVETLKLKKFVKY